MVHRAIVNISGYVNICFRQQSPNAQQRSTEKSCKISNPLELAGTHFQKLKNLSSILARELVNLTAVLSTGKTFNSSYQQMLASFHIKQNKDQLTARADALRIIYFVKKTTSTEDYQDIARFEASFNNLLASMGPRMKCAKLSYQTERTATDALQDILKPELWPLCFSVVAIAVLACVIRFTSTNAGCLRTVFLMFSSLAFSLTCSAGVVSITNSAFSSTYLLIPFLLLRKATTDVVLYLIEWERKVKLQ